MIYLDNAATSWPKPPEVLRAVNGVMSRPFGNPGRGGHRASLCAGRVVYACREAAARYLGCAPERVIFTLNCTDALNMAIRGCLHRGDHVLATHDAHNAVMRPLAGMEQLVADLHDRGYRLYILSNAGHRFRTYEYKLPHPEYLSGILVSAEERMIKPDPRIFLRLCDKFSLKPEECLFIDDSAANVQGAESTGMTGYCFADGDVARLRAYLDGLTK